jgi:Rrf2 family protein
MRLSARGDYALRAAVELATHDGAPMKVDEIAELQEIPPSFLVNILAALRRADLVRSRRGADGGYWLARPARDITVADVIRATEGPLAGVRGEAPEDLEYKGAAAPLREVWVAARASLREVLEQVTLADVVEGALPQAVADRTAGADAWHRH